MRGSGKGVGLEVGAPHKLGRPIGETVVPKVHLIFREEVGRTVWKSGSSLDMGSVEEAGEAEEVGGRTAYSRLTQSIMKPVVAEKERR